MYFPNLMPLKAWSTPLNATEETAADAHATEAAANTRRKRATNGLIMGALMAYISSFAKKRRKRGLPPILDRTISDLEGGFPFWVDEKGDYARIPRVEWKEALKEVCMQKRDVANSWYPSPRALEIPYAEASSDLTNVQNKITSLLSYMTKWNVDLTSSGGEVRLPKVVPMLKTWLNYLSTYNGTLSEHESWLDMKDLYRKILKEMFSLVKLGEGGLVEAGDYVCKIDENTKSACVSPSQSQWWIKKYISPYVMNSKLLAFSSYVYKRSDYQQCMAITGTPPMEMKSLLTQECCQALYNPEEHDPTAYCPSYTMSTTDGFKVQRDNRITYFGDGLADVVITEVDGNSDTESNPSVLVTAEELEITTNDGTIINDNDGGFNEILIAKKIVEGYGLWFIIAVTCGSVLGAVLLGLAICCGCKYSARFRNWCCCCCDKPAKYMSPMQIRRNNNAEESFGMIAQGQIQGQINKSSNSNTVVQFGGEAQARGLYPPLFKP